MIPEILYEDNHIIVAVKPQNMPSQADASHDMDFLTLMKQYIKKKYDKPGAVYLGLVHRLDRPAGGVMVFARTSKAAARLSAQIKDHSCAKRYYAITARKLPPEGAFSDALLKDSRTNRTRVVPRGTPRAKQAELSYRMVQEKDSYFLADIFLKTGRPHQIRVQFSHAGAPLVGDIKYGGVENSKLCLWAYSLSFLHPTKKERMAFTCPPPGYFPWNLFEIHIP
ncbi:RluA family pseudouridine synthase [Christensenella tenuis]|uniref:RNA pseudouridylate synthase n=1 Tax=Christensenella tenuis TaxID=2763033 RepID=A0ABR7EHK9_9FIRM|nr:RluA family pseudouridine synthase [Christensenella tenuis]MBC5648846.1 RluA family pseudouridine synthase [Christensenella tenuis]